MKQPPDDNAEMERLGTLARYFILDTPAEQNFDQLTEAAAKACQTQVSLLSLIDDRRQWFKSKFGTTSRETPREISFCNHTIRGDGLFVVEDALQDERFRNNPLVRGEPGLRFYAGAPLIAPDGSALGALCVIDLETRRLSDNQKDTLRMLSRQAMALIEMRRRCRSLVETDSKLPGVFGSRPVAAALRKWSDQTFVDVNDAFLRLTSWKREEIIGRTAQQLNLLPHAWPKTPSDQLAEPRNRETYIRPKRGGPRPVIMDSVLWSDCPKPHVVTTFVEMPLTATVRLNARLDTGRLRSLRSMFNDRRDSRPS